MKQFNDITIIGIDQGYGNMKTANTIFPTAITAYDTAPMFKGDVLEYGGKYYVVGSGRQPLQKDKTQTEDLGSDTCLKFARTHLFCQHPTRKVPVFNHFG